MTGITTSSVCTLKVMYGTCVMMLEPCLDTRFIVDNMRYYEDIYSHRKIHFTVNDNPMTIDEAKLFEMVAG